ncbi:trafficking protein particle complex subunit 10 [Scheffersomyces amazonensis]|uniref:trafficking protein particle complex subunit 10 n=1 Tax=Scheffersomyces amazonensis TaxID=1078765 RepID=UPI00315D7284
MVELNEFEATNPVQVGYYDPFNLFGTFKSEFESKLPLTNLHWKFHASKPQKSIASLPIQLVEEIPKTNDIPNCNVYLRLMIIKVDNIDFYRSQVRPLIKEWLKNLVLDKLVEWMIILYIPSTTKDKHSTLMKTSSFDKLKIDFGYNGKEWQNIAKTPVYDSSDDSAKFLKVKEDESENSQVYNDLELKLKQLLIGSFDKRFQSINKQLNNLKSDPYQTFTYSLDLANLLYDMRLYQDSLDIYQAQDPSVLAEQAIDYSILNLPDSYENYKFDVHIKPAVSQESINLFSLKQKLFANQTVILQHLAYSATTRSISALFVTSLYQKLVYYINDVNNTFKAASLNEYSIALIEYYLDIPVSKSSMEVQDNTEDEPISLSEIYEFRGELKLLLRTAITNLAAQRGYKLISTGILEEVSLNDDNETRKDDESVVKSPKLTEILSTEGNFHNYFEKLTELVIEDFSKCTRSKSIDILSIDLALLKYQREEFLESLEILEESFEVYISNGWNYMGSFLLDVYLNCLNKTRSDDYQGMIFTGLRLLSCLKANTYTQIGINNYSLLMHSKKLEGLIGNILHNCLSQDELIDYPLENLFSIDLLPYIYADDSTLNSTYYIEIEFWNSFQIPFTFQNITLNLEGELGDKVIFSTNEVKFESNGSQKIRLYSNSFVSGNVIPRTIRIRLNENLELSQEFGALVDNAVADLTVIHTGNSRTKPGASQKVPKIFYYQNVHKLWCEFVSSKNIELGSTEVVLRIHNGQNDVKNVSIDLIPRSVGLSLDLKGVKVQFETLESLSIQDISFPVKYFGEKKVVDFTAKVSYEIDSEIYSHIFTAGIDTTLTIAVSVQDIFRPDFLYSNFSVGTASPKFPIRIISKSLSSENENYAILKPKYGFSPLIAFGEQPASFFFKVVPESGYIIKSSDTLDLAIEFSNLKDECSAIVQDSLLKKLKTVHLEKYWFLLKLVILDKLKYDLNNYGINDFVQILNNKELLILAEKIILQHVELKSDQVKLFEIIESFLNNTLEVGDYNYNSEIRRLHISVAVPYLKYLHIIEAEYEKKYKYVVGEPIKLKVKILTETKWYGNNSISGNTSVLAESSPSPEVIPSVKESIQLQIQNDDNWLISGFKKFSFDLQTDSNKVNEVELVVIPLNIGKLLLPKFIIKSSHSVHDDSLGTYLKNGQETLLVVPELDSITFSF